MKDRGGGRGKIRDLESAERFISERREIRARIEAFQRNSLEYETGVRHRDGAFRKIEFFVFRTGILLRFGRHCDLLHFPVHAGDSQTQRIFCEKIAGERPSRPWCGQFIDKVREGGLFSGIFDESAFRGKTFRRVRLRNRISRAQNEKQKPGCECLLHVCSFFAGCSLRKQNGCPGKATVLFVDVYEPDCYLTMALQTVSPARTK